MTARKAAAFFAFGFGIAAIASHILLGSTGIDYVLGCLSAAIFATYGWYLLRRETAPVPIRLR